MKQKKILPVLLSGLLALTTLVPSQISFAAVTTQLPNGVVIEASESSDIIYNTDTNEDMSHIISDPGTNSVTTGEDVSSTEGIITVTEGNVPTTEGSITTTGGGIATDGAINTTTSGGSLTTTGEAISTTGSGITQNSIFSDTANHWAESIIEEAVLLKLVNGYEDGSFKPDNSITREEFYKLLVMILSYDYDESLFQQTFSDVKSDEWYAPYIKTAVAAGLTQGYEDGTFGISRKITRQEASKAAASLIDSEEIDNSLPGVNQARDLQKIDEWALPFVDMLYKKGYISGDNDGNFRPGETLTRAEATKIVLNIKKNEKLIGRNPEDITPPEISQNPDTNVEYEVNDCTTKHLQTKGAFYSGRGTKNNPYIISTQYQLNHIREHLNDNCYYLLTADIILSVDFTPEGTTGNTDKYDWENGKFIPIGTKEEPFRGVFDGGGHTLSELDINGTVSGKEELASYAGLFGAIDENSEVTNLTLSGAQVNGNMYVSGIVSYNSGKVKNCTLGAGSKVTGETMVGGICGTSTSLIEGCTNEGEVECKVKAVGGIAGSVTASGVGVSKCVNNGTVSGGDYAGGIIGTMSSTSKGASSVQNCTNSGNVSSNNIGGGIAGGMTDSSQKCTISDCKNMGLLTGKGTLGGMTGEAGANGNIINCVNYGSINSDKAGGIAGDNSGTVTSCYNKGNLIASSYAGGISSRNLAGGTVMKCYNNASVTSVSYSGGLVGENAGTISNCYNSGAISGDSYAGGLFGKSSGSITLAYNAGSVTGTRLPGLIGGSNSGTLKNVFCLKTDTHTNVSFGESAATARLEGVIELTEDQMKGNAEINGITGDLLGFLNRGGSSSASDSLTGIWTKTDGYAFPHLKDMKRE